MKALVLSAGFGTRLLPYTRHTPKPLFTVAGRPLLDIWIDALSRAGCEAVAVNVHHLHERIETFLAGRRYPVPVVIRHEPEILGTGGAIRNLADFWDERPFFVVNGDVLTDIDLSGLYAFHQGHSDPVTLAMVDDPSVNTVAVRSDETVTGFDPSLAASDDHLRTFTGVQVLDSAVLDFLPDTGFSSSIDAFRSMIDAGLMVRAFMPEKISWRDLGTPERYREASFREIGLAAFRALSPDHAVTDFETETLRGDGSARQWFRLKAGEHSVIIADHGIRRNPGSVAEVDAFIRIGEHLANVGAPVPKILASDPFAGMVALDDLGDTHLQDVAISFGNDEAKRVALYQTVIDRLVEMSQGGFRGFDPTWAYETPGYDRSVILERECRYFVEAFAGKYLGADIRFDAYLPDFEKIAEGALRHGVTGFMHRDFQSRNIMVKDGAPWFIDFQAGRIGPIQYDLAALLIDPYVGLPEPLQARLLEYAIEKLRQKRSVDGDAFRQAYRFCALSRNLQILGAFGHLSAVCGKKQFEAFIPEAFAGLYRRIQSTAFEDLSGLRDLVFHLSEVMKARL